MGERFGWRRLVKLLPPRCPCQVPYKRSPPYSRGNEQEAVPRRRGQTGTRMMMARGHGETRAMETKQRRSFYERALRYLHPSSANVTSVSHIGNTDTKPVPIGQHKQSLLKRFYFYGALLGIFRSTHRVCLPHPCTPSFQIITVIQLQDLIKDEDRTKDGTHAHTPQRGAPPRRRCKYHTARRSALPLERNQCNELQV